MQSQTCHYCPNTVRLRKEIYEKDKPLLGNQNTQYDALHNYNHNFYANLSNSQSHLFASFHK